MAHARKQIRDALVTALTGLATTGARVYVNRARSIAADALPALVVRIGDEDVSDESLTWPPFNRREARVEIEALASGATAADTLDAILAEVETAIGASFEAANLNGRLAGWMRLVRVQVAYDDETTPALGSLVATYIAPYHLAANAPETVL